MNNEIIIYDTEYWTDKGVLERCWRGINDHPPVLVQIGAYKVKLKDNLPVIEEWVSYISPIGRAGEVIRLNKYFVELTGILQDKLDSDGVHPEIAIAEFAEFVGGRKMFSYGDDVVDTFLPTCFMVGIRCPFTVQQVRDVRQLLRRSGVKESEIDSNRSGTIANHVGVKISRCSVHDAKCDAYSVLEALRRLLADGKMKLDWLSQ